MLRAPDAGRRRRYRARLTDVPYLGIVCPLMVLDRPHSGYWTLNIADTSMPFTGVIQTTAYIDPKYVGGHHLVYMPKYTAPGSRWQQMPDADVIGLALATLKQVDAELRQVVRALLLGAPRALRRAAALHRTRTARCRR